MDKLIKDNKNPTALSANSILKFKVTTVRKPQKGRSTSFKQDNTEHMLTSFIS